MAKPDPPLRQISQSCLHGLIILFCCPITCLLLTFAPAPRCGSASHTARLNRHARRNTRMHSCILVSPAGNPAYIDLPPPAEYDDDRSIYGRRDRGGQGVDGWDPQMAHLTNQGNRIFAIRPTDGILCSGNVAAGARGFKVGGKELVGTLGKGRWKQLLAGMMRERDLVVEKETPRNGKWWKKTEGFRRGRPEGMERRWVEGVVGRVRGMMEKGEGLQAGLEEDDQEGDFEVWKVEIQTVGEIVQDESWRGTGRGSDMWDGNYLWSTKMFTGSRLDWSSRPVEDLFPGSWAREYIDGDAEPFTVAYGQPWPRPWTNDSGILAEETEQQEGV